MKQLLDAGIVALSVVVFISVAVTWLWSIGALRW